MKRQTQIIAAIIAIVVIVAGAGGAYFLAQEKVAPREEPMPQPEKKMTKVTFILNFIFSEHHAIFYLAKDKGFYAEQGLDVEIVPGRGAGYAIDLVSAGKAEFGYGAADIVVTSIAKNAPLKVIYMVFQRNPVAIFAREDANVKTLQDLYGKTIAVYKPGTTYLQWQVAAARLGLDRTKIEELSIGPDQVTPVVVRQAHATSAFISNLPDFTKAGVKVTMFPLKDLGIDYMNQCLFTRTDFMKEKPDIVRKFIIASDKAMKYVIEHPGEAIDILLKHVPTGFKYGDEATQFAKLMLSINEMWLKKGVTDVNGLGAMDNARWEALIDFLVQFKLIPGKIEANTVYTNEVVPGTRVTQ